jgi:hypothetical protein
MILLTRLREPALELCRLSNIGNRESAGLETVRILSLPELTQGTSLRWATCFGEHPGHALFSKYRQQQPAPGPDPLIASSPDSNSGKDPLSPTGQLDGKGSAAPRLRLRSVPKDGIISVVMQVVGLSGYFRTIDLSVRCRTLLEFSHVPQAEEASTEATGGDAGADGNGGTGTGGGGGAAPVAGLAVPWGEWGPANTRILEHDTLKWGSLVGERRATVGQEAPTRITMRDYNPSRVQRALVLADGEAGREVKLECGSVVKVVKETSVYRGGEWFLGDIESSLPYVETVRPYEGCEGIFMDEDNLLAEVRTEVGRHMFWVRVGQVTWLTFVLGWRKKVLSAFDVIR